MRPIMIIFCIIDSMAIRMPIAHTVPIESKYIIFVFFGFLSLTTPIKVSMNPLRSHVDITRTPTANKNVDSVIVISSVITPITIHPIISTKTQFHSLDKNRSWNLSG